MISALVQVAAGGAIGAVGRYLLSSWAIKTMGTGFPYGTLAVNLLGSFAMGVLLGWIGTRAPLSLFLMTGLLGGFTTFSAFSLEVILLIERGQVGLAIWYIGLSVCLGVALLWAGLSVARTVL